MENNSSCKWAVAGFLMGAAVLAFETGVQSQSAGYTDKSEQATIGDPGQQATIGDTGEAATIGDPGEESSF